MRSGGTRQIVSDAEGDSLLYVASGDNVAAGREIFRLGSPMRLGAPLLLLMVSAGLGCGGSRARVDAPEPTRNFAQVADTLPSLTPGAIVAPLRLDLAGATRALEQQVPRRFGNIDQRITLTDSKRKSFAFEVTRDPFKVAFDADTVILTSVVHYKGRGWYDPPIGPTINGECGTEGPAPRARLTLRVVPSLTPAWRIRVWSRVDNLVPLTVSERDQCKVSFLSFDVTSRVLDGAAQALRSLLPQVDRDIAGIDIRTPLEKIWSDLQQPIRITDSLWLLLGPEAVHLGKVEGTQESVGATIGVLATPRIVTGIRPTPVITTLPPLGPIREVEGFSLPVEATFDYGVMSDAITKRLRGKKVKVAGGKLEVKKVTVIGVGKGRLAVGLDFSGTAAGRIWFVGAPHYDAASGLITVPDLDFDATSAGLLVQSVAWLKADQIREFVRSQATVQVGTVLKPIETMAVKQMNRTLARGVELRTRIDATDAAGILVRAGGLVIRARAIGAARLDLTSDLFQSK